MLEDHEFELDVGKLTSWVDIETPTGNGVAVNRLTDLIEQEAKGAGASVQRWRGGVNSGDALLLTSPNYIPGGSILLHGHIDTVHPLGSLQGTLKPRVENGRLYGPGVYDMKAGTFLAFQEFRRSISRPNEYPRPISLMIVPDEEHGSVFSRAITQEIARDHVAAFVFEPSSETCSVIGARKGYGEYVISTHGRAAHAGMRPHDGQSAIAEICQQILNLEKLTDDVRGVSCNVGKVAGGSFTNVVPEIASAQVDLRFDDDSGWEYLKSRMENLKCVNPAIELTLDFVLRQPPLTSHPDSLICAAVRAAGHAIRMEIRIESVGGASDANLIADAGIPVLDGLGPQGGGAHTLGEYIEVDAYSQKARFVRSLLTGGFI